MTEKNLEPIVIRLATIEDVKEMTDLHLKSFTPDNHIPVIFGKDYVRATYRWLVTSKESYALVSVNEDKIVGLVAMCDRSFTFPMFIYCLPQFILSILKKPRLLFDDRLWKRLFRQDSGQSEKAKKIVRFPGVAQMTIGAVDQNFRGRSIFPLLITNTKIFSKQRNSRAIRAGIYKTNTPCRKAFVKDGWIEIPELETDDTVFYMAFLDNTIAEQLDLNIYE